MPRPRKHGPRAKSNRLSRAHKRNPEVRDKGTYESQANRHALINGADPQQAATASGILFANGYLSQAQHHAALRYARLHAFVYGKPWPHSCPLAHELAHHGGEPPEGLLAFAESRLVELNALLAPDERRAVANLAVLRLPSALVHGGQTAAASPA